MSINGHIEELHTQHQLQNMRWAVLFLCLHGHGAWLLWVQLLTECTSSLSSMSRVIVLNSSYILLTVFCHLVRQPSCKVAFPRGYFSDTLNQFDVKMPEVLGPRKSAYCFVLFWYLSQWVFFYSKTMFAKLTSVFSFFYFNMATTWRLCQVTFYL